VLVCLIDVEIHLMKVVDVAGYIYSNSVDPLILRLPDYQAQLNIIDHGC
jgi:hypothetical protein